MGPKKKTSVGHLVFNPLWPCVYIVKLLWTVEELVFLHVQAQMKLKAWDTALASLKQVLKIEPNNEKALFRSLRACSPIITRVIAGH